eukprot:365896-Chlamydomonas_euryale.AAC.9
MPGINTKRKSDADSTGTKDAFATAESLRLNVAGRQSLGQLHSTTRGDPRACGHQMMSIDAFVCCLAVV